MAEDFGSAAMRHERDARSLLSGSRVDNAGYLAGYGIECSLKLLIQWCGGPAPKSLGHDLGTLSGEAVWLAALLSPGTRRYRIDDAQDIQFAAHRWRPELRYEATGSLNSVEAQRLVDAATVAVRNIVLALVLDGLVEIPK